MGHKGRTVLSILAFILMTFGSLGSDQKRPITVKDCVRTRRILLADDLSSPVQMSPDGTRVAYVVKAPNVVTNRNDYQLYIRDLKETDRREDGRRLLQADRISSVKWLGLNHVVARVERKSANSVESEVDIVDANTGVVDKLEFPIKMEEFSISADRKVVVFSSLAPTDTPTASRMEEQKVREERGYPVGFGEGTGTAVNNPPEYEIYLGKKTEMGKIEATKLYFTGPGDVPRRTILRDVQRLNLSPDGEYLLLNCAAEDLPEGWENHPLIKELRGLGSPAASEMLALYDISTGQLRLGFNYPGEFLTTSWADDSRAYSVISAAPFDTNEGRKEGEAAVAFGRVYYYLYRFTHLFAVNANSGVVTKVVNRDSGRPGNWEFSNDGPLSWKRSDGEMIVRVSDKTFAQMKMSGGTWKESKRFEMPQDNTFTSMFSSDGRVLVGVSQAVTTPPDLFVQDITTGRTTLLTDLNPEYRSITLGGVEKIEWTNRYGSKCSGKLLKPVGYVPGERYPLVLMANDSDQDNFIADSLYTTAFAPQSLANAGFAVLMAKYPREDKFPKCEFPGEMGQAYNWMAMMESALDLLADRGVADRNNVGIVGFSRTSWLTDFMLTHTKYDLKAASSADSGLYTYGGYFRYNRSEQQLRGDDKQVGGPPYGDTLKYWLEYAPAFNADKVTAPVLMEYTGTAEHGFEFFVALSRLKKPVELYRYPKGGHPLDTPFERVASLQRNVDWFRFWMHGNEGKAPDYDPEQFVRWRALRSRHGVKP